MSRKIETPLSPQTFTSGMVVFYAQKNTAPQGHKPVYRLIERLRVPYEDRKIGDVRYYSAMQVDEKLDKVVRVPCVRGLQPSGDIAIIAGSERHYRVQKIAQNSQTAPDSWDVTLEITKQQYELPEEDDT